MTQRLRPWQVLKRHSIAEPSATYQKLRSCFLNATATRAFQKQHRSLFAAYINSVFKAIARNSDCCASCRKRSELLFKINDHFVEATISANILKSSFRHSDFEKSLNHARSLAEIQWLENCYILI